MSEKDIAQVMPWVWKAIGSENADARDEVIFELYRQRAKYRAALERIADYPHKGWTQQTAEKTLAAIDQAPGEVTKLNKAIEAAVNRGLAATMLDDLVEMMCKEGVPLSVSKRVLLQPSSRRASDWRNPGDILSVHADRPRTGTQREEAEAFS